MVNLISDGTGRYVPPNKTQNIISPMFLPKMHNVNPVMGKHDFAKHKIKGADFRKFKFIWILEHKKFIHVSPINTVSVYC